MKFLKISLCFIIIISIFSLSAFALSSSTYADLSPTSSQVQNLVSFAYNYKSFKKADYVVFQDAQYSYRIVWADKINFEDNRVSASDVEIITYSRSGTTGSYTYSYDYSTDAAFSLAVNNLVVSNIEGVGSASPVYEEFISQYHTKKLLIFIMAFLGVVMFLAFRRTFR